MPDASAMYTQSGTGTMEMTGNENADKDEMNETKKDNEPLIRDDAIKHKDDEQQLSSSTSQSNSNSDNETDNESDSENGNANDKTVYITSITNELKKSSSGGKRRLAQNQSTNSTPEKTDHENQNLTTRKNKKEKTEKKQDKENEDKTDEQV